MKPYYDSEFGQIYNGESLEVLKSLPNESVNCCVTSPPYWGLRDYGIAGQLGLEKTPDEYVSKMVEIFREVKRVLRDDGTLWLNLGDTYAAARSYQVVDNKHKDVGNKVGHTIPSGLKQKDLVGIPWRIAFALQADGWYLRQDIIWSKPNPMPESVKDRCTKSHEYIFLLSKSQKYYYDQKLIKESVGEKGNANSFRGGAYCNGNIDNSALGKRTVSGNKKVKIPNGCDTGKGSHGTIHKNGRSKSAYSFARKTSTEGKPNSPCQHRPDRDNIEYIGKKK